MFPKKITEAMKDRIREVGRKREEARRLVREAADILRTLPTTRQLAEEAGVGMRRVQELIADIRNSKECEASNGVIHDR